MNAGYLVNQPNRDEVDAMAGRVVVEFGTDWCGYCRAASRFVEPALSDRPDITRIRAEDGKGRPLGRSFRVKLWPTLVFLRDGEEVSRVVRPGSREAVEEAIAALDA
ncbi:thioredoxin [Propioniciclava sinopodophylli]|uniref:Thioredoxin n=1 Tax=Propioniciclava sinopodophylli TaxID=1837344 RepID=A0A4V6MV31_9ACTN|nr:thioredoxin family protein [Propioniciclava sinopodophylli]TBT87307.1 thioredoxin [Propioniciclava sinopodophylli]